MSEQIKIDPTKRVTHFIVAAVGFALHNPDTDWRRIAVCVETLEKLITVNGIHGKFEGAKILAEFQTILRDALHMRSREKLVNLFEALKREIAAKPQAPGDEIISTAENPRS